MFSYRKEGFTLVELLVVVAIIGLLISISVINIRGTKQKGRDARRISDIKILQTGLALYYNDFRQYPVYDGFITGTDALSTTLINAGAMNDVPIDPLNETVGLITYKYYYQSTQGKTYVVQYYLETDSILNQPQGLNIAMP